jgi:hypothetical protein
MITAYATLKKSAANATIGSRRIRKGFRPSRTLLTATRRKIARHPKEGFYT